MKKFFEGFAGYVIAAIIFSIPIFILFVFPLWKGIPTFDIIGSYDVKMLSMPLKEAIVVTVIFLIIGFVVFARMLENNHQKRNNRKQTIKKFRQPKSLKVK